MVCRYFVILRSACSFYAVRSAEEMTSESYLHYTFNSTTKLQRRAVRPPSTSLPSYIFEYFPAITYNHCSVKRKNLFSVYVHWKIPRCKRLWNKLNFPIVDRNFSITPQPLIRRQGRVNRLTYLTSQLNRASPTTGTHSPSVPWKRYNGRM